MLLAKQIDTSSLGPALWRLKEVLDLDTSLEDDLFAAIDIGLCVLALMVLTYIDVPNPFERALDDPNFLELHKKHHT